MLHIHNREVWEKNSYTGYCSWVVTDFILEPLDKTIVKPYDDNALPGNSYGVRVLVNPPNSLPAAGVMGYDILAGHATYIAFDITERKRLPKPYSTCKGVGSMALGDGLAYSFTECKNICIHRLIRDTCGCFPTIYKVRRSYTALNETSCGYDTFKTKNNNMMACQKEYLKDIETRLNYANDCNCHPPCEDIKYSTTLSQSEFPSENSMTSFWKTLLEQNSNKERLKAFKYHETFVAENAFYGHHVYLDSETFSTVDCVCKFKNCYDQVRDTNVHSDKFVESDWWMPGIVAEDFHYHYNRIL